MAERAAGLGAVASALLIALACAVPDASAAITCKPRKPRPIVTLKSMGACNFDPERLSFAGEPVEQARCLLRSMNRSRNLGPQVPDLPAPLAERIGRSADLPTREKLTTYLSRLDLEMDFAAYLWQPLSRARDNDPDAPMARYFVIHDTSGPNYGSRPFPSNIDVNSKINNLRLFFCPDGWTKSHVVVNRTGRMLLGHDFSQPWRETKFERAPRFEGALKGLFLHIELIQPRRRAPRLGRRNDAQAPTPGFTAAQYEKLALLYTIASVRAGTWIIPAFHSPIDADIRGGHDDPQNFELAVFADSLEALVRQLKPEGPQLTSAPAE